MELTFIRFHGFTDPYHLRTLKTHEVYYAIPGGKVATRQQILEWNRGRFHDIRFVDHSMMLDAQ